MCVCVGGGGEVCNTYCCSAGFSNGDGIIPLCGVLLGNETNHGGGVCGGGGEGGRVCNINAGFSNDDGIHPSSGGLLEKERKEGDVCV